MRIKEMEARLVETELQGLEKRRGCARLRIFQNEEHQVSQVSIKSICCSSNAPLSQGHDSYRDTGA